jgi:hypothetical protein
LGHQSRLRVPPPPMLLFFTGHSAADMVKGACYVL